MTKLSERIESVDSKSFSEDADYFKFLLEERKDRREDLWPKRMLPWFGGALIPILSALLTYYGVVVQQNETKRQADAKQISEDAKTRTENARLALELYVKNPDFFERQSAESLFHLQMIAAVCDNSELKKIFAERYTSYVNAKVAEGKLITSVVASLPDRFVDKIDYASFVAYVQVLQKPDRLAKALQASDVLRAKGMKVENPDTRIQEAPSTNEIRFYKSDQKGFADGLAALLQGQVGEKFVAKQIKGANLPNGVIELWIASAAPPNP